MRSRPTRSWWIVTSVRPAAVSRAAAAYAACAERLDGLVVPVIAALVKSMSVGAGGGKA